MLLFIFDHPFIVAGVLLVAFYVWMSVRVVGPTEVGLVLKRFSLAKAERRQPHRIPGRSGLSSRSPAARTALDALAAL